MKNKIKLKEIELRDFPNPQEPDKLEGFLFKWFEDSKVDISQLWRHDFSEELQAAVRNKKIEGREDEQVHEFILKACEAIGNVHAKLKDRRKCSLLKFALTKTYQLSDMVGVETLGVNQPLLYFKLYGGLAEELHRPWTYYKTEYLLGIPNKLYFQFVRELIALRSHSFGMTRDSKEWFGEIDLQWMVKYSGEVKGLTVFEADRYKIRIEMDEHVEGTGINPKR
jgi:hypothetical protein